MEKTLEEKINTVVGNLYTRMTALPGVYEFDLRIKVQKFPTNGQPQVRGSLNAKINFEEDSSS